MKHYAIRAAAVFGPLILLAACASDQQRSVDMLNCRLATTLKPEIDDNRVALQPLADGARVTLLDASKLPDDAGALDNRTRDPRASMIEGLLDPTLMKLTVADTGQAAEAERQKRVQSFVQYLEAYRLGPTLQGTEVMPSSATTGRADRVGGHHQVDCPSRTSWPGYGQGQSDPSCH